MPVRRSSPAQDFECVVVGAGLAGLAATGGLQRAGFSVACVGPNERAAPGRTVALFGRSLDILEGLGVREEIEANGAPLRVMRLVDDTGSLFAPGPAEFRASEIGRDAFGVNIENAVLAPILEKALGDATRLESEVAAFEFGADAARLTTADGGVLEAKLIVAADGRKAADIDMSRRRFDQVAMTLTMRHSRPHDDVSTEFHTREGPFTLVPLPPAPDAPYRSSLVWLMSEKSAKRRRALDDKALAEDIRRTSRGLLGDIEIESDRGGFSMTVQRVATLTGRRVALVGDAAHAFPPIGAQGLNLGLRDVEAIVATAAGARKEGADIGGEAALARYAAARRPDIAMRTFGVGLLNGALLSPFPAMDVARGFGLSALASFGPLRRAAMREGIDPFLAR
jgi:2-octaprenyl-6-methoxyphenol hydroxylase